MSNRISRQDENKLKRKLVLENIRRVFFASLASVMLVPVLLILNKSTHDDFAEIMRGVLICYGLFSSVTVVMSYLALSKRDIKLSRTMYRTFWLVFQAFSFVLIHSDKANGSGFTFYAVLAGALFLIPAMDLSEQIYYDVLLVLYTVFASIKFHASGNEIFNMAITVGMLFAMSRVLYVRLVERLTLKEHERVEKDNELIDSMTGLLNRKGFERRAYAAMPECIGKKHRVSIVMIDIDEMNRYNDSYGPERGDECIRVVSELVKQAALRNTEVICRQNGGRFILFVEGGDDMEPVNIAEKVRKNIERKRIPHGRRAGNNFVTVSVGAASCIPRSENDFNEMYDEAEDALFDAKEQGRNVTVYDEQIYGSYRSRAAY